MVHRRSSRVLLIVAAFALFLIPVAAIAAAGFTDVDDDSVFVADIQWMKDNGITKGCNPPTNDRFCPGSNVTREQMSAFMHRLAVGQVVDAATAVEADNADTLDGKDSTAFLGTTEKAADSNKLDGKDSATFVEHGDIVLSHSTSELTRHQNQLGGSMIIQHFNGGNFVVGSGRVVVNLTGPAVLGGVNYGLKSIEYCILDVSGGSYVDNVQINSNYPVATPGRDETNRTTDGCYVVAANATGAQAYDLLFAFLGSGQMRLSGIQSTWAPAASLTPLAVPSSDDGSLSPIGE